MTLTEVETPRPAPWVVPVMARDEKLSTDDSPLASHHPGVGMSLQYDNTTPKAIVWPSIAAGQIKPVRLMPEESPPFTPAPMKSEDVQACLHARVRTFVAQSFEGCKCTRVDEERLCFMPTAYCIDKRLEYLTVMPTPEFEGVSCALADVEEIFSVLEDGERFFPPQLLEAVGSERKELLIRVCYCNGHGEELSCYFLEESKKSFDANWECLKILCFGRRNTNDVFKMQGAKGKFGGA